MAEDIRDKQISRILIEGYKSIEKCDLKLNTLNVLIGANGAGKSNLISFFKLIGKMIIPSEAEIKINNRARSAKLRIAEKK